ncbi:hypothetical protein [Actinokineospora pegani]|uniref:hypothetical protein n=1 Tax=Actinokineospora pegani TaxID=2654637 RepID=UPI0012EA05CF|nr:hypothetical protein [Actinokineospora pegani]
MKVITDLVRDKPYVVMALSLVLLLVVVVVAAVVPVLLLVLPAGAAVSVVSAIKRKFGGR